MLDLQSNREEFNSFVYTSLEDAVRELEARQQMSNLDVYLGEKLPQGIPAIMQGKRCLVLFRHLATSNYEFNRFAMVADALSDFTPLIFEYTEDNFHDINDFKYYLGKLRFHKGVNKKGESLIEHVSVIDFTTSNKKPLAAISTFWGENLVDFHHRLFKHSFPQLESGVADISQWLHKAGPRAQEYYKSFLTLFIKNGILFENFLPNGKELAFTKDIILPALKEIQDECGVKPLIVALEPTDIEGDHFWHSHPYQMKKLLTHSQ